MIREGTEHLLDYSLYFKSKHMTFPSSLKEIHQKACCYSRFEFIRFRKDSLLTIIETLNLEFLNDTRMNSIYITMSVEIIIVPLPNGILMKFIFTVIQD